jgi:hypothetical protein
MQAQTDPIRLPKEIRATPRKPGVHAITPTRLGTHAKAPANHKSGGYQSELLGDEFQAAPSVSIVTGALPY